jgi:hypothetical protein
MAIYLRWLVLIWLAEDPTVALSHGASNRDEWHSGRHKVRSIFLRLRKFPEIHSRGGAM